MASRSDSGSSGASGSQPELTGMPLRQGLAVTGSVDQFGNVQPVGGVNEKIEGFFDTCQEVGLTGSQGCLLPAANVGDLMLRSDVVDACRQGRFHVWPIRHVREALAILTDEEVVVGAPDERGEYPSGSLMARAVMRDGPDRLGHDQSPRVAGR